MSAATITRTGIVTRDGRDYATPAAWARITDGTTPDQVRRAASDNATGLRDHAIPLSPSGKIKAYPVDLLQAWEAARADGPAPGGQPSGDLSTVAAELGVSKMRVWRAVNAGLIDAVKDDDGVWRLNLTSVADWRSCGMPAPRAPHHK